MREQSKTNRNFQAEFNPSQEVMPSREHWAFCVALIVLTVPFIIPLNALLHLSLSSSLYSHVVLIPLVSAYFFWTEKRRSGQSKPLYWAAAVFAVFGLAGLSFSFFNKSSSHLTTEDIIAPQIFSYVMLITASGAFFMSKESFKQHAFSFILLLFIVPFPSFVKEGIEIFLQHTSAEAAYRILLTAGTPVLRHSELVFELPNIKLEVAPQCSGIRSSLVLFIVSIVAAKLFLSTAWKRWILVLCVIPLAIIRNGFRVFTIGQLCTLKGPQMVDSWIHHSGGPLFFALSLIPFFGLLFILWRSESKTS